MPFKSDDETQKKAQATRKKNGQSEKANTKRSLTNAIKESPAIQSKHRIKPETQAFIRDELLKRDPKGIPYLHRFVKSFLDEAKKDPNSRAGIMLASSVFGNDTLSVLDAEISKQMAKDTEFSIYRLRNTLYDKQQEVFDNRIDRQIGIICSRRSGKTELNARLLARAALKPNTHSLYLNRSFDNAVRQIGKPLEDLLGLLEIPYKGSPASGMIEFDNSSWIMISGFNNAGDIDKFRGYSLTGTVIIDEVAHLRNPRLLITEVLEPAMIDSTESQLIMTGTPPRNKATYAYEMWHNPNIKHYWWTFKDNPYIPNRDKVIEQVCKSHNTTEDDPFIQREYLGNTEAFDLQALVFNGYKTYDNLPNGVATHAYIGIDWGFSDSAAVISALVIDKKLYVIDEWHAEKQATSVIAQECKRQYDNIVANYKCARLPQVITDTNDKSGSWELYYTYKIPNVCCAYKYNKDIALDQMAEWMRSYIMNIKPNSYLSFECDNTLWKRDEATDEIIHELDEDSYHANGLMALLYISRQFGYEVLGKTDLNKEAKRVEGAQ